MPQDTDHSPAAPQDSPAAHSPGKWARVAREFSEKAPLTGIGEEFLRHTRQFRKSLRLKSPFDPE